MRYDLSKIMRRAWRNFRKGGVSFSEALHRSWLSAKSEPINTARIAEAKTKAGVTEQVQTWTGWRTLGREVVHGSRALFHAILLHGSKGDGATYKASFFGESQTQPITA